MPLSDLDLESIKELSPNSNHARLENWLGEADQESQGWLLRIHESMLHFLDETNQSIRALRVRQGASSAGFAGLLKHLGTHEELKPYMEEIQTIGRFYLALLGFSNANLVFINQLPAQQELMNPPGTVDLEYRLAADLLLTIKALFDSGELSSKPLTPEERIGLLVISLVLRDGALSTAEITMALNEIAAGRIIRHSSLCYVYGPISKNGVHLRRLHLSALSVALGLTQEMDDYSPTFINHCLEAARKRLNSIAGKEGLKLKTLLSAAQHYLRLADNMPQFVIDYAQAYTHSDSLEETCFARLLGAMPNPLATAHERELRKEVLRTKTQPPQYTQTGAIREIANACTGDKNREISRTQALVVAKNCLGKKDLSATERIMIEWVIWMLDIRKLAPSTSSGHLVTLYRPLQASLIQLDMQLTDQTPDQWDALVDDMTRDLDRRNNLFDAVAEMTRYLNFISDGNFRHSGYSDPALVNAYVISNVEKDEALKLLDVKVGTSDPELAKQAKYALELAYNLGIRRWEYLGLTFRDVVGRNDPIMMIRNNSIRWVKSDTSNRSVPLKLVSHSPLYESWRQQAQLHGNFEPWDSILESHGFPMIKHERRMFDAINDALYQVTGSPEVTYHTLRHTAVCRMLLALYWGELELNELCEFDYFREIDEVAPLIKSILLRQHTHHFAEHKTVSAIVGHLSFSTTAGHYFHFMDLIRWGILRQINQSSLVPDNIDWILTVLGKRKAKVDGLGGGLDLMEKLKPKKFLRHSKSKQQRLDFSGLGLREKLQVVGETVAKDPELRDAHLVKLIPDDAKRSKYLSGLSTRLEFIRELLENRKQWSTKHGAILVMPKDRTVALEILGIINRVAKLYDNNQKLHELSNKLLNSLEHLKARQPGCFTFKTPAEAKLILEPVTSLLDMTKTEIDCFYYYTKRFGSVQRKQKEKEMRVKSLDELPSNFRGELIVRFVFGDADKNSPQRTLIWAMSSIFCAYGSIKIN